MSSPRLCAWLILAGVLATPAFAQSPAQSSSLTTSQTNLDQAAAAKERRAATARGQLTTVTPEQARTNEMTRCANLPAFYKVDCEARVNGQGESSGSVVGGGVIKETVTTVTPEELANAPRMELKPQDEPSPTAPQNKSRGKR